MKLDKKYVAGLLSGVLLCGTVPVVSQAVDYVSAVLTRQAIYLDGEQVDWTVYNVNDENYIRLADLCPELGVGLAWDPVKNAVLMNSDGTVPEVSVPSESVKPQYTYYTATATGEDIPFPMPEMSYYGVSSQELVTSAVASWANMAVYGMLGGYAGLNTTDYVSQVLYAEVLCDEGTVVFVENGREISVDVNPSKEYVEDFGVYDALTFYYVLETRDGEALEVMINLYTSPDSVANLRYCESVSMYSSMASTPDSVYVAFSDDGGYFGLSKWGVDPVTNEFIRPDDIYPMYHYVLNRMVYDDVILEWDDNGNLLGEKEEPKFSSFRTIGDCENMSAAHQAALVDVISKASSRCHTEILDNPSGVTFHASLFDGGNGIPVLHLLGVYDTGGYDKNPVMALNEIWQWNGSVLESVVYNPTEAPSHGFYEAAYPSGVVEKDGEYFMMFESVYGSDVPFYAPRFFMGFEDGQMAYLNDYQIQFNEFSTEFYGSYGIIPNIQSHPIYGLMDTSKLASYFSTYADQYFITLVNGAVIFESVYEMDSHYNQVTTSSFGGWPMNLEMGGDWQKADILLSDLKKG